MRTMRVVHTMRSAVCQMHEGSDAVPRESIAGLTSTRLAAKAREGSAGLAGADGQLNYQPAGALEEEER